MSEPQKTYYPVVGVEKEVHLIDYFNVVLRRWKFVVVVFLLTFCVVSLRTLLMQPIYEAESTIEVSAKRKGDVFEELEIGGESAVATEIEKLRSRSLVNSVIRHLNMHWQVVNYSEGLGFTIREFSVDGDLHGLRVELTGPDQYRILDAAGKQLCLAKNGEPCSFGAGHILVDIDKGVRGQFIEFERVATDELVDSFLDNLSVSEVGKQTNVIRVRYRNTDPVQARDVVNLLVEGYLVQNVNVRTLEAGKSVEFISDQLQGVKEKLDRSEQELQEYKVQTGLATLGAEGRSLLENMVSLEQQKGELGFKRQRIEYAISTLRQAIANSEAFTPPTIEDVTQIAESARALAELEAEKNTLLVDYTTAHPQVIEVQAKIRQMQETMLSTYQSIRQELLLRERDIGKTLAEFEIGLSDIPEAELELAKRMRVNQVNSELYTFLLQKQQEARIAEASTISNATVIDQALTPRHPVAPNKRKNLALGLILGLMLGVGVAFLLDYLDQTIKTSEEIREKLDLPVFGIIPRIPFADEDERLPAKRLVTTLPAKAPVVEAFRALRTNLNYTTAKEKHKIIMITSSLPGEGKSTVTGNLAVILAQTGARVLLVGTDLRRPSLYQMLNQKNEPGLVNLLAEKQQKGVIRRLAKQNLDFLPSGSVPPNPAEILDSDRMRKLMPQLRERYDYVVIDAPPVLPVTDATILAPQVDMVLVVLEPCRVPEKAAQQMVDSLKAVDAKIAGVILNDKSGRGFKYYGNYRYYGNKYYRGYYGEKDAEMQSGPVWGALKRVWDKLNS